MSNWPRKRHLFLINGPISLYLVGKDNSLKIPPSLVTKRWNVQWEVTMHSFLTLCRQWGRIRRRKWKDERFWSKTRSGFKFWLCLINCLTLDRFLNHSDICPPLKWCCHVRNAWASWCFSGCLVWRHGRWTNVLVQMGWGPWTRVRKAYTQELSSVGIIKMFEAGYLFTGHLWG